MPEEHQCTCQAADELNQAGRNEIHGDVQRRSGHAEVEITRHREVGGELRVFEMSHPRRTDAGVCQVIVQPRRGPVAEVGAHGLMDWRQHLEQDEESADQCQRPDEAVASLHRAHEHAHGNGEYRGQQPAQQENDPPRQCEWSVGLRQGAEEPPLVALTQTRQYDSNQSGEVTESATSDKRPPAIRR